MITVNSISGGKTSAFVAAHFPADYNIFQLVRLNDPRALWMKGKDEKTRQLISDRIGIEFIGTAEDDTIIYTILDLEQFLGKEIKILTAQPDFGKMIQGHGDRYLPSPLRRYCTSELKIQPTFDWWKENFNNEPVEMRIGFRANEMYRMKKMINKCNNKRLLPFDHIIGSKETKKGTQNVWETTFWQKPVFPLIENLPTFKDQIESFWEDKPVLFADLNNCIWCFHRELYLLRDQWDKEPVKMEIAAEYEDDRKYSNDTFKAVKHITYRRIKKMKPQNSLDFVDCDSGYCGI